MKLSFSTLGCHDYTLDQIIDCAVKYGFDGVEIRIVEKNVRLWETRDLKPEAVSTAKKKFKDAGIEVIVLGAGTSFAHPDEKARSEHLDDLKRYVELAQGLSCPYIRVFGGPVPEGRTMEETVKSDIEGYTLAKPIATAAGVTLLFETHDSFSASTGMLPLVKGLGDGFGVVWDVLHPLRFGENIEDTWKNLKPYIKHIHIKDSTVYTETDFDFQLCGEGKVPIPQIVKLLESGGYDGYLSFEWERGWHPEIAPCDIAFPRYVEYMKKILA
ncbi:MAG: sugar phosphate isomerase/epimerase [Treponema sp.]|jgi:sugar phosphate isomerase/epimerase|nr:sugar phosphate isomerase/epimerase [Treponema sp.]